MDFINFSVNWGFLNLYLDFNKEFTLDSSISELFTKSQGNY